MRALGIDLGATAGFGMVETTGRAARCILAGSTRDQAMLAELVAQAEVELLVLETVDAVISRDRFGAGMATAIVRANASGTPLHVAAALRGLPVIECTAAEWRKAIVGKTTASDARIKVAIGYQIASLPKRTNAHARDALGAALYGLGRHRLAAAVAARSARGG